MKEPTSYRVIRSARKTICLQWKEGELLVRAPMAASEARIRAVVEQHAGWIEKQRERFERARKNQPSAEKLTQEELHALAEQARKTIPARVAHYAPLVGVTYGRITIRSQRTRWGSCSAAGNLNFNCLLTLAPPEVLDSVVVHELCHRLQPNHSKRFYAEVLRVCPAYRSCQTWLRQNGAALLGRL